MSFPTNHSAVFTPVLIHQIVEFRQNDSANKVVAPSHLLYGMLRVQ